MRRKLLIGGSVLMFLIAAAHTFFHFQSPPTDPAFRAMEDAMRGYTFPLGLGMTPSMLDVYRSFSLTMGFLMVVIGLLTWAAARSAATDRQLRWVAMFDLGCSLVMVSLNWSFRVPPPLISFAITTVVFAVAVIVPAKEAPVRS